MFFPLLIFISSFIHSTLTLNGYADSMGTAVLISLSSSVQGKIDNGGDQDYYKVQLVAGRTYWFTMQSLNPPSPTFDNQLFLYGPTGTQLAVVDDAIDKNAQIKYTAATTDYYFIRAQAYYDYHSGTYVFAAMDVNSCSSACTSL